MKTTLFIIYLFISYFSFSQEYVRKYFNVNKKEITQKKFYKQKNYKVNLDVFIQSDSLIIGMLVNRTNQGKLDEIKLSQLRQYLSRLSGKNIDSSKTIVINYLSSTPKTFNNSKKSTWTIFNKNYLISLNKLSNIHQIWVNNPNNLNLEYFHKDKINWVEDSNRIIENQFFPFEFQYGNFVVINSNGNYISHYAEYGPEEVLKYTKKCIKLK